MKKILILFTAILCSNIQINSQNKHLNGKVKTIIKTIQKVYNYSNENNFFYTSEITKEDYHSDNKIKSFKRKIMHNDTLYYLNIIKYFYNNKGRIEYADGVIFQTDSIHYKQNYTHENDLLIRIGYQYNYNEIEHNYYTKYNYNNSKRLTDSEYSYHEKYLDSNKKIRHILTKYSYNKKERIIKSDSRESINYDETFLSKFKTNKKGLLITKKDYDKSNKLIKTVNYNYKFDIENNWILKKKIDKKNGLIEIVLREIKYYK